MLFLQVFISEQVLYTEKELKQHGRAGDVTGALAESGFSGHPSCRFCRRQFYGDTELFVHMHQTHEQCFLCRRARPDKYVYYRNYAELEGVCRPSSSQGSVRHALSHAHNECSMPYLSGCICALSSLRLHSRLQHFALNASLGLFTWISHFRYVTVAALHCGSDSTVALTSRRALWQGALPVRPPGMPGDQVRGVRVGAGAAEAPHGAAPWQHGGGPQPVRAQGGPHHPHQRQCAWLARAKAPALCRVCRRCNLLGRPLACREAMMFMF